MLEDMLDVNEKSFLRKFVLDHDKMEQALSGDRNFCIACELGVHYPILKAMLNREDLHIRTSVSHIQTSMYNSYYVYIPILYMI